MEAVAEQHNDTVYLADELEQMGPRSVGETIYMLGKRKRASLPSIIRRDRDAFVADALEGLKPSGQVRRVAARFGLVAVAGELATEYGITGWPKEKPDGPPKSVSRHGFLRVAVPAPQRKNNCCLR